MKKSRPSAATRQFPWNSTNSAWLKFPPLILLLGFLFFYAVSFWHESPPPSNLTLSLRTLQKNPWSTSSHLRLSEVYYTMGNLLKAQAELAVAHDILSTTVVSSPEVLGDISQLSDLQAKIEASPQEYQKKQRFWQEVTTRYPTYRDAWVRLLYLAYNAGDLSAASFYLEKVNELNPNYVQGLPEALWNL